MNDIGRAKELLAANGHTCVLCRGAECYISDKRGVAPLLGWIDEGAALDGFAAADKVVGRAAALLFALVGIREVYAEILSEPAADALRESGIAFTYGALVPGIINREGTGPCPMERAVMEICDPKAAPQEIRRTLAALRAAAN